MILFHPFTSFPSKNGRSWLAEPDEPCRNALHPLVDLEQVCTLNVQCDGFVWAMNGTLALQIGLG